MANAGGVRAGSAYVEIGADTRAFFRAVNNLKRSIGDLGRDLTSIGVRLAAVGGAAVGGMVAATRSFAVAGSALLDLSKRTGVSVESLSKLGYAAEQNGATLDDVGRGVVALNRTFADASNVSDDAAAALRQLGLSVEQVSKMSPEQRFMAIVQALHAIPDPAVRAALAMKLFGKNGLALLPMIAEGTAGIAELSAEAERLGIVVSTEAATAANEFGSAMNRLTGAAGGVRNAIGAALAPTLSAVADLLAINAAALSKYLRENEGLVRVALQVAAAVTVAGMGLTALGKTLIGVSNGFKGLAVIGSAVVGPFRMIGAAVSLIVTTAATAVAGVFSLVAALAGYVGAAAAATAASVSAAAATVAAWAAPLAPIALLAAALGGLVAIGYAFGGQIQSAFSGIADAAAQAAGGIAGAFGGVLSDAKAVFSDLYATATTTFGGISDALAMGDLAGAAEVLWLGLQAAWVRGQAAVMSYVDPFVAFLQNTFTYAGTTIATTWESLWSGVSQTFNTFGAYVLGAFDNVVNGVMAAWDGMVAAVQKSWNWVQSFIREGFDLAAENAKVDDAMSARARQRESSRPGVDKRVAEADAQNQQTAAATQTRIDAMNANADQVAAGRYAANDRRAAERQTGIDEVNARLAAKRDELAAKRKEFDAANAERKAAIEAQNAANDQSARAASAGMAGDQSKAEAAGTFSAMAIGGLGFGQSLAQKQLDALNEIAANTRDLEGAVAAA